MNSDPRNRGNNPRRTQGKRGDRLRRIDSQIRGGAQIKSRLDQPHHRPHPRVDPSVEQPLAPVASCVRDLPRCNAQPCQGLDKAGRQNVLGNCVEVARLENNPMRLCHSRHACRRPEQYVQLIVHEDVCPANISPGLRRYVLKFAERRSRPEMLRDFGFLFNGLSEISMRPVRFPGPGVSGKYRTGRIGGDLSGLAQAGELGQGCLHTYTVNPWFLVVGLTSSECASTDLISDYKR